MNEFAGELGGAVKFCAVSGWRGAVQVSRSAVKTWRERESVSPSVAAIPEKKMLQPWNQTLPSQVAPSPSRSRSPRCHHQSAATSCRSRTNG